jgi:hypothetical protein
MKEIKEVVERIMEENEKDIDTLKHVSSPIQRTIHAYLSHAIFERFGDDNMYMTIKWYPDEELAKELKEKHGIDLKMSSFRGYDGDVISLELLNLILATKMKVIVYRDFEDFGKREVIAKNWVGDRL